MSGLLVRNRVHSLPLHTPWDRRSFSYNTLEATRDETWALVLKNLERWQQRSTAEMGRWGIPCDLCQNCDLWLRHNYKCSRLRNLHLLSFTLFKCVKINKTCSDSCTTVPGRTQFTFTSRVDGTWASQVMPAQEHNTNGKIYTSHHTKEKGVGSGEKRRTRVRRDIETQTSPRETPSSTYKYTHTLEHTQSRAKSNEKVSLLIQRRRRPALIREGPRRGAPNWLLLREFVAPAVFHRTRTHIDIDIWIHSRNTDTLLYLVLVQGHIMHQTLK
jgi:hypothetical protein